MATDKELQCNELEWFLLQSDGECGLKSMMGPMLERSEQAYWLGVSAAQFDDGVRRVRSAPVEASGEEHCGRLGASWAKKETELAEFYKSFGVGVTMPSDLGRAVHVSPDPYNSNQCDFTDKSRFAQARKLWKQWLGLSLSTRRTLAAWYFGMNPTEPVEVRVAYQEAFQNFAAVAYWGSFLIPLGDEFSEGDRVQMRIDLENAVRAAHREWYNVGERLAAA